MKLRIQAKVLLGTGSVVAASVLTLSALFLVRANSAFQRQFELRAEAAAESVVAQCQFDVLVGNRSGLQRTAEATLGADADTVYVSIEDAAGTVLATATRSRVSVPAFRTQGASRNVLVRSVMGGSVVEAVIPVIARPAEALVPMRRANLEFLGRVRVAMSLEKQRSLVLSTLQYVALAAAMILGAALAISYLGIRSLLEPIAQLAEAAELIGSGQTETVRIARRNDDEIGVLVSSFNEMSAQIADRTRQLNEQIEAKEQARADLVEAQQRLIDLSRRSGMAEVASSVLHNVGNVLNSVNVSASLVAGKVKDSRMAKLKAVVGLLEDHRNGLQQFLETDAKGQRVLPYLGNLVTHFEQEQHGLLSELDLLTAHVGHIKQIIATQQNYAKVSGLIETFDLRELVEDAIRIAEPGLRSRQITLLRQYEDAPPVSSDKHQILQILLNLLRNARQAVEDGHRAERVIRVRIQAAAGDLVRIEVKDSGVGIEAENLTRIFGHGFTTRADGHGFGLHSGALAAKQLGGELTAESEGPGLGATFTLVLPVNGPNRSGSDTPHEFISIG